MLLPLVHISGYSFSVAAQNPGVALRVAGPNESSLLITVRRVWLRYPAAIPLLRFASMDTPPHGRMV